MTGSGRASPWSLPSACVTVRRSFELGQQLYAVIESCKKPEALWSKLSTGNYDWLGVRRNGRYVLGRPRLAPAPEDGGPGPDPVRDRHRVECLPPLARSPRWEAYPTADEARDAYAQLIAGDPVTPLRTSSVCKLRLILDGESVEELLVVRTLPRMV
jgi:hypothetical protein